MLNILVTTIGGRLYLLEFLKQILKGKGELHVGNSVETFTMKLADKSVITPMIYDEKYIDFLLDYCSKNQIKAVISFFDIDLYVLAQNKQRFLEKGIQVLISDQHVVNICNDKWATYQFLTSIGLKQPKSFVHLQEAKKAVDNGEVQWPLIIKPRWGQASIGVYKVEGMEELEVMYARLNREIFNSPLKYESEMDKKACVIIQEVIAADEYGLEILNDLQGRYVTMAAKRKLAIRGGESYETIMVDSAPFVEVAKRIADTLGHIASIDIDAFLTTNNEVVILEMNARFGAQYAFTHAAGGEFLTQVILWLMGKETDNNLIHPKVGVRACKAYKVFEY